MYSDLFSYADDAAHISSPVTTSSPVTSSSAVTISNAVTTDNSSPKQVRLDSALAEVIDNRIAKQLAAFELYTVDDLLRYHPRKYAEPGKQVALEQLTVGEFVSVFGKVEFVELLANKNGGYRLIAQITDGSNRLNLTFFGKSQEALKAIHKELSLGADGIFIGTVSEFNQVFQLTHPKYSIISEANDESTLRLKASKLIPMYRASAKTPTWTIQKAITTVLENVDWTGICDPIPAEIIEAEALLPLAQAFQYLHNPDDHHQWQAAQHRFRWEEALVLQTTLAKKRLTEVKPKTKQRPARPYGKVNPAQGGTAATVSRLAKLDATLPFTLTAGQQRIGDILSADLESETPMQRLLVGEVGSGKTVIALRAMLQTIDAGAQAVLLAPTEILAQQHARTITKLLGPLAQPGPFSAAPEIRVELLTGSSMTKERRQALLSAISGEPVLLVGTHALLEEKVKFFDLGLVVVDEQQRFGVEQRDKLRTKGANPHLLVMTATPIPRTIALTAFGDLDVVELRDMPPGRHPITTHVVPTDKPAWVRRTWERVAEEVAQGHRVFVVCPRIFDSDESDLASVDQVVTDLRANPALAGIPIAAVHGQMSAAEKDSVMQRFASGESPIVVATTVIEVGVDIPEATVMVVLDADRFGISQLHQLRGRIGRGQDPGLCLLLTSAAPESTGGRRVAEVAKTNDGFALAQIDLQMRAEGDVLGTKQSGHNSSLRLLRVAHDGAILEKARNYANELLKEDMQLTAWPALGQAISTFSEAQRANLVKS